MSNKPESDKDVQMRVYQCAGLYQFEEKGEDDSFVQKLLAGFVKATDESEARRLFLENYERAILDESGVVLKGVLIATAFDEVAKEMLEDLIREARTKEEILSQE